MYTNEGYMLVKQLKIVIIMFALLTDYPKIWINSDETVRM